MVLIVPCWLAVSIIVADTNEIADLVGTVLSLRIPPPPEWVTDLPLIGERLAQLWGQLTSAGVRELAPKLTPYAGALSAWFVSALGSVGETFVQFLLTVAVAAVMYASGERAAATVIRFGRRWRAIVASSLSDWPVRRSGAWRSASW